MAPVGRRRQGSAGRGLRRTLTAAAASLALGLVTVVAIDGLSAGGALRWAELLALVGLGVLGLAALTLAVGGRMAGWHRSEEDFERIVVRSEQLAREGLGLEPGARPNELDPLDADDFDSLVADALEGLAPELRRALEHNVAVVVADGGRRRGAYGLYEGDGVARDGVTDRIVIFRDTLRADFGHDPEGLREQVLRTVRHELAHHVGFDELGVRRLGL